MTNNYEIYIAHFIDVQSLAMKHNEKQRKTMKKKTLDRH
jgi:hypothetical protein